MRQWGFIPGFSVDLLYHLGRTAAAVQPAEELAPQAPLKDFSAPASQQGLPFAVIFRAYFAGYERRESLGGTVLGEVEIKALNRAGHSAHP